MNDSHTAGPAGRKNSVRDITPEAVDRQLTAMASVSYDVLAIHAETGKVMKHLKRISLDGVQRSVPMLRAVNAQGSHIYIRPHDSDGQILVDDITPEALPAMEVAGFKPALLLKTSPEKLQARVRVSAQPIAPEIATTAARELARRFGADPAAANWRQLGRLAGFTNRKPEYRQPNGYYPFVTILSYDGQVAPEGATLLAEVAAAAPVEADSVAPQPDFSGPQGRPCDPLVQEYRRLVKQHVEKFVVDDYSRLDFMITSRLARARAECTAQDLAWAVVAASPNIRVRHKNDEWRYALYTAEKVLKELGRA